MNKAISQIESSFPTVSHKSTYRWYYFYCNKEMTSNALFCVILLGKKYLKLRFFVPPTFQDPNNISHKFRGWFWHKNGGEERGVRIETEEQLVRTLPLVKQAYEFASTQC